MRSAINLSTVLTPLATEPARFISPALPLLTPVARNIFSATRLMLRLLAKGRISFSGLEWCVQTSVASELLLICLLPISSPSRASPSTLTPARSNASLNRVAV